MAYALNKQQLTKSQEWILARPFSLADDNKKKSNSEITVTKSVTKGADGKEVTYHLLISRHEKSIYDETLGKDIQPIESISVTQDEYMRSLAFVERVMEKSDVKMLKWKNIIQGRRCDNDVELFLDEDEKETPGLRAALEREGMKVDTISFIDTSPEPAEKKKKLFLKAPKSTNDPDRNATPLDKCVHALRCLVNDIQAEHDLDIEYGLVCDAGLHNEKKLMIVNMRRLDFLTFYRDNQEQHFKYQSVGLDHEYESEYCVLAAIDNGVIRLKYRDEKFTDYFVFKDGKAHGKTSFYDDAVVQDRREEEEKKVAKKQAKKHRRQLTTSTLTTSVSEPSTSTTLSQEIDDDVIKARQREKNRKKKKQRKARQRLTQIDIEISLLSDGEIDEEVSFTTVESTPEKKKVTPSSKAVSRAQRKQVNPQDILASSIDEDLGPFCVMEDKYGYLSFQQEHELPQPLIDHRAGRKIAKLIAHAHAQHLLHRRDSAAASDEDKPPRLEEESEEDDVDQFAAEDKSSENSCGDGDGDGDGKERGQVMVAQISTMEEMRELTANATGPVFVAMPVEDDAEGDGKVSAGLGIRCSGS